MTGCGRVLATWSWGGGGRVVRRGLGGGGEGSSLNPAFPVQVPVVAFNPLRNMPITASAPLSISTVASGLQCGFHRIRVDSDYWSAAALASALERASRPIDPLPSVLKTYLFQWERELLCTSISNEFENQKCVKFGCEGGSRSSLYDVMQAENVQGVPGKRVEAGVPSPQLPPILVYHCTLSPLFAKYVLVFLCLTYMLSPSNHIVSLTCYHPPFIFMYTSMYMYVSIFVYIYVRRVEAE